VEVEASVIVTAILPVAETEVTVSVLVAVSTEIVAVGPAGEATPFGKPNARVGPPTLTVTVLPDFAPVRVGEDPKGRPRPFVRNENTAADSV
jgi:hypothetical protein